ncbi:MAG: molybdenum hydroxylase, partial [Paeniclostridium sordellii]|nr:molybdenum hydroxylase [Paeniclostridium sordellii]
MLNNLVIVRGAGDIATGIIHKLNRCGFNVLALEVESPLSKRRKVCFSEAI